MNAAKVLIRHLAIASFQDDREPVISPSCIIEKSLGTILPATSQIETRRQGRRVTLTSLPEVFLEHGRADCLPLEIRSKADHGRRILGEQRSAAR